MENNQLTLKLDIGQLIYKIYEELLDNNMLSENQQNLFNSPDTITEIALLTLYQIVCLDRGYDKIKFKVSDLTGINTSEIVVIDNMKVRGD